MTNSLIFIFDDLVQRQGLAALQQLEVNCRKQFGSPLLLALVTFILYGRAAGLIA